MPFILKSRWIKGFRRLNPIFWNKFCFETANFQKDKL